MGDYIFFRGRYRSRACRVAIVAGTLLCAGWGMADTAGTPPSPRAARIQAVEEARIAFERATSAGAENKAPYEYAMAREYLELAREELKEGDRIGIHEFTAKSVAFSNLAIEKASGGAK